MSEQSSGTSTETKETTSSGTSSDTAQTQLEESTNIKTEEQSSDEKDNGTALSEAAGEESKEEDGKTEEDKTPTEEQKKEETSKSDGGEYDLELSEESPLTQEDLDAIATEASDRGLTLDQSKDLITQREDFHSRGVKAQNEYLTNMLNDRKAEFDKDVDFSGDNRAESFAAIKRVTDSFGDEGLTKALNDPFIGNNIHVAKFLKRLGDAMGEDPIEGKGGVPKKVEATGMVKTLRTMYPEHFQEKAK